MVAHMVNVIIIVGRSASLQSETVQVCFAGAEAISPSGGEAEFACAKIVAPRSGPRPLVLDTSALIDRRVVPLILNKWLDGSIVVSQAVRRELCGLANCGDEGRRPAGRRGLEALEILQRALGGNLLTVEESGICMPADDEILALTSRLGGRLVTTDRELAQKAEERGCDVLNPHAIAAALLTAPQVGEVLSIRLMAAGRQPMQAVGTLTDGTPVFVNNASHLIGQEVSVTISRVLQRETSRVIFARPSSANPSDGAGNTRLLGIIS